MTSFVLPPHLKSDDDPRATKNIPSAKRGGQKRETATPIRRRLKGKQQAEPMDTTQPKQAKGNGKRKRDQTAAATPSPKVPKTDKSKKPDTPKVPKTDKSKPDTPKVPKTDKSKPDTVDASTEPDAVDASTVDPDMIVLPCTITRRRTSKKRVGECYILRNTKSERWVCGQSANQHKFYEANVYGVFAKILKGEITTITGANECLAASTALTGVAVD